MVFWHAEKHMFSWSSYTLQAIKMETVNIYSIWTPAMPKSEKPECELDLWPN